MTLPKDEESLANNPPPVNVKEPPALYRHVCTMYEAMLEEAQVIFVEPDDPDTDEALMYEGYISKTYARTKISNAYQHLIPKILKDYNCIVVITTGVRNRPTRALMVTHPSEAGIPDAAWSISAHKKSSRPRLTSRDDFDTLSQSVSNLAARVGQVSLGELAKGIDAELAKIRHRLDLLEAQGKATKER